MEVKIRSIVRRALEALLVLVAAVAVAGILWLIVFAGPEDGANEILFFVLLFFSTSSVTAIAAYRLSFRLFALKRNQGNFGRATMQGFAFGLLITAVAWLQALRMLTWEAGLVLTGIVLLMELLLLPRFAR